MTSRRYAIMGAGEVGRFLARSLSSDGHAVTVIDPQPEMQRLVEDDLDAAFVLGSGCHLPTLEAANVGDCELFVAASSSDEANLAASLLAKTTGAPRTVVRVKESDDITRFRRVYERAFRADMLLSTQLLTTTRILNQVLGHNTQEVEYLAGGALQVRRTVIEAGSVLAGNTLAEAQLPPQCLVLALFRGNAWIVPRGTDQPRVGDAALVIGTPAALDVLEHRASEHTRPLGRVVIAGGGATAEAVVRGLESLAPRIQILERDRARAEEWSARFPRHEVLQVDVTDAAALAAENVGGAHSFLALTGNDETNLMACLLAQELGAQQLTALVQRSETSTLWRKIALIDIVSPRTFAAERIRAYIDHRYAPQIVSFDADAAGFVQRRVHPQSPVAGAALQSVEIPRGLIVAAVLRNGEARVPRGDDSLRVGDEVIVFAQDAEQELAQLLFPGPELD